MEHGNALDQGRGNLFSLFGAVEPFLVDEEALAALGRSMLRDVGSRNGGIPAGYTYFGQFLDHDLTFIGGTPAPVSGPTIAATEVPSPRSPQLDLDSLYGDGFEDERLIEGKFDLVPIGQRGHDFRRGAVQPLAAIVDPRNDDNLLVAQVQVGFMRQHNRHMDSLAAIADAKERFALARHATVLAYQSVIVNDYLKRVLDPLVFLAFRSALTERRTLLRDTVPGERMRIPVEFAGAAFRFGHAMVLPGYRLNRAAAGLTAVASLRELLTMTGRRWLAGQAQVPERLLPDWSFLLGVGGQASRRLGPSIATGLGALADGEANLAVRNLRRGNVLGLPCGQALYRQVIAHHGELAKRVGLRVLAPSEIIAAAPGKASDGTDPRALLRDRGFDRKTPLWYYVLCEASRLGNGERLGPLASLIVADTMLGLLLTSRRLISDRDLRAILVPSSVGPKGALAGRVRPVPEPPNDLAQVLRFQPVEE